MADTSGDDSLRVTAEERLHPAYQKLARAIIALARQRQETTSSGQSATGVQPDRDGAGEAGDD